jgi:hypothetical protein
MNATTKAIRDQADEDGLKLHHLMNVIKLAAFATEARRVLEGIECVTLYRPEMAAVILESVPGSKSWTTQDDEVGSVLSNVAFELSALAGEITDRAYALATHLQEVKA